jgi:glycerol-3-phosphate dehydrogenase
MIAWELANRGHEVDIFERGSLMEATSSKSSKLLHGGLRYIEHGQWRLVREALQERAWWFQEAPALAKPLRLLVPVYDDGPRGRFQLAVGVKIYDLLASGSGFPVSQWLPRDKTLQWLPTLRPEGLKGAYEYWDAQMDDRALGLWAAEAARRAGVRIAERSPVIRISTSGMLTLATGSENYDRVINACGPWACSLLDRSGIQSRYRLELVRGTHLLLEGEPAAGCVLQVPDDRRIIFVLPYQGKMLLGTTEVRQTEPDPTEPSLAEADYLLGVYNRYFHDIRQREDVASAFAGVRPLVRTGGGASATSREYFIERKDSLISVFGGKWTTARALARRVYGYLQ